MSGNSENDVDAHLAPSDVRKFGLDGALVVLTGTSVAGDSRSAFDSRLGIVSDFLDAGANAVVVALWPASESEVAGFAADFYRQLESGLNVGEALSSARLSRLQSDSAANYRSWAGFQLHIR